MTTTTIPNSTAAVVRPARNTNDRSPTPRRLVLSGLRRLGSTSPGETPRGETSRLSPRSYFSRSVSYPQNPARAPRSNLAERGARPDDSRDQAATGFAETEIALPTGHTFADSTQGTKRATLREPSTPTASTIHRPSTAISDMARHQPFSSLREAVSESTHNVEAQGPPRDGGDVIDGNGTSNSAQTNSVAQDVQDEKNKAPTIRLYPHQEYRQGRPSLSFAPIVRTLPSESSVIRVGRYSEREGIPVSNPTGLSDAPVGFKSKVVSRKHCEFSFANGSWQIKDVCSSSGTFLNHIRLSQPNTESRLFPVKDGDIVQLGIDFRGGEEMIFRCVKIRIECNRAWQKRPNNFNMTRHAQLRELGKGDTKVDGNKGECSICLGDVAPCQSLFIAACAHVWHYRCIRRMLMGSHYPQFTCPNCRAITDLEAEFDVEEREEWEHNVEESARPAGNNTHHVAPSINSLENQHDTVHVGGAAHVYNEASDLDLTNIQFEGTADPTITPTQIPMNGLLSRRQTMHLGASLGIAPNNDVEVLGSSNASPLAQAMLTNANGNLRTASPTSADIIAGEGPLTPRNDAGPFVFDGSAGQVGVRRLAASAADESE